MFYPNETKDLSVINVNKFGHPYILDEDEIQTA